MVRGCTLTYIPIRIRNIMLSLSETHNFVNKRFQLIRKEKIAKYWHRSINSCKYTVFLNIFVPVNLCAWLLFLSGQRTVYQIAASRYLFDLLHFPWQNCMIASHTYEYTSRYVKNGTHGFEREILYFQWATVTRLQKCGKTLAVTTFVTVYVNFR